MPDLNLLQTNQPRFLVQGVIIPLISAQVGESPVLTNTNYTLYLVVFG